MALFASFCLDRLDRASIRKAKLDEHCAHFQKFGGAVRAAGPMTADAGDTQCGSLIVYEAETIDVPALSSMPTLIRARDYSSRSRSGNGNGCQVPTNRRFKWPIG
jgi:uncharacterized protein YciI